MLSNSIIIERMINGLSFTDKIKFINNLIDKGYVHEDTAEKILRDIFNKLIDENKRHHCLRFADSYMEVNGCSWCDTIHFFPSLEDCVIYIKCHDYDYNNKLSISELINPYEGFYVLKKRTCKDRLNHQKKLEFPFFGWCNEDEFYEFINRQSYIKNNKFTSYFINFINEECNYLKKNNFDFDFNDIDIVNIIISVVMEHLIK